MVIRLTSIRTPATLFSNPDRSVSSRSAGAAFRTALVLFARLGRHGQIPRSRATRAVRWIATTSAAVRRSMQAADMNGDHVADPVQQRQSRSAIRISARAGVRQPVGVVASGDSPMRMSANRTYDGGTIRLSVVSKHPTNWSRPLTRRHAVLEIEQAHVVEGAHSRFPGAVCRQRWTVRLGEVELVFGQTGRMVLDITARDAHDGALKWTTAPSTPRAARSI